MKKLFTITMLMGLMMTIPVAVQAQTTPDKNALLEFSKKKQAEFKQQKQAAVEYAKQNDIPVFINTQRAFFELMYIDENGMPRYYQTENANSAKTISTNKVHPGAGLGFSLDGGGMTVHEWDGGAVRPTHQEFGNRVNQVDGVAATHYHSTHVGGTLIASGVQAAAKGMAPAANLNAYDWNDDEAEMADAGANGALVSNHSYGYANGWSWNGTAWVWYGDGNISNDEDYKFGFYDTQAKDWDQIASDAPGYLIVKSAGNDRGDGPDGGAHPKDGPYDCIGNAGNAKNILTVGAVEDIPDGYSEPSDVVMSDFSSWGPCDDGRIKPDICTNGVSLYSCDDDNDADYTTLSGTSMAAPSATGSLILLQEHYQDLNGAGNLMRAATLKALVIHTADEAGPDPGPDYMFGWGLMNTYKAAQKISEDQNLNVIDELTLANGGTYTRTVKAIGDEPLIVTIVWTDKPGTPPAAALDPIDPMIVNELDLRLTQGSNTYYPWKLDRNNPSAAATRNGENNVDNVEEVTIDNPVAGAEYTIVVDHDGALDGGQQAFSIVISGITEEATEPPVAEFSANPTSQTAGNTVTFTDQSSNFPTSWSWSFPGGTPSSSTERNPVITYNTPGTYNVELTVSNAIGSDTETKENYITITEVPIVYCDSKGNSTNYEWISEVKFNDFTHASGGNGYSDFTNLEILLNAGEDVSVTLTPDFSGTVYPENWRVWIDYNKDGDFEDAGEEVFSPAESNAVINGNFTVAAGATGNTRMRVSMKWDGVPTPCETFSYGEVEDYTVKFGAVVAPVADFSANETTIIEGESVTFTDLSTNNPDGWSWTFNGGTPSSSTVQNPVITYNTAGTYTVSLTASNSGGSDMETKTDYITVLALPGCAGNASPSDGATGVAVTANLEWDAAADATGYKIYFGTDDPPTNLENGTDLGNVTSYDPSGNLNYGTTYYWKVVAYNTAGDATGCAVWSFTTIVPAPVADFSANETTIIEGESVTFTDLSTNNPDSWSWTFNDGTPSSSTEQNPVVTYNTAGTYNVSLTASNAGGSDTETKTDYITVLALPGCAGNDAPADGATGVDVTANLEWNAATDATGYKIYFGTDNPPTNIENGTDLGNVTSYDPSGDLNYSTTYYWKVVAYNTAGDATGCAVWSFTTVIAAPVADFSASATSVIEGESVSFTDLSTNNPDGWSWTFNGGTPSTSTAQNPSVTYNTAGTYTVSLTASNSGGSDTETKTDYITVLALPGCAGNDAPADDATDVAVTTNLEWNAGTDATGYKLYFGTDNPPTNIENGTDLGNVTSYDPSGDLNYSTTYYWKVVAYNTAGDATGCAVWSFTTVIAAPVADFSASATSIIEGESITFTDLSTNNPDGWSWTFNGGTPSTSTAQNPSVTYNTAGTYTVSLTASNSGGSDTETKTDYITVLVLPGCAGNVAPADGATDVLVNTELEWSAAADATGYKIYFGTDNPPTNIENGSDLGNVTTYTPRGDLNFETTYYWKIVAYNDAGNATGCATWSFTTKEGIPVNVLLSFTDFEDGWGVWTDGGGDCFLYTGGTYAAGGDNAADIQDNSGVSSSFYLTNGVDVHTAGYVQIDVNFDFKAISMDNSNEDFWVQYYDGSAWHTVRSYAESIDFVNGVFYNTTVSILESDYTFPPNMKIRFMCDASGNADDVYIDNIRISASTTYAPPDCTTAESPVDGADNIGIYTNLEWESNYNTTGYKLYFGTDNPPTNIVDGEDLGDVTNYDPVSDLDNNVTYYWKVVPYNAGGDASGCDVWSFTTEAQTLSFVELSYTDFEDGWSIWTDGGGDCKLYTAGTYAPQGNNAAEIRDNSGVASSFYLTNGVDVHNPGYVQLKVEFDFIPRSMDNPNEDFWVQYYDGSAWHTVASYAKTTDFENNIQYHAEVNIYESDYTFPTNMKIRFMCDASGNYDFVYVDMIKISATTESLAGDNTTVMVRRLSTPPPVLQQDNVEGLMIYPNPVVGAQVTVYSPEEMRQIGLYDITGNLLTRVDRIDNSSYQMDVSQLEPGVYIIRVVTGEGVKNLKLIKK